MELGADLPPWETTPPLLHSNVRFHHIYATRPVLFSPLNPGDSSLSPGLQCGSALFRHEIAYVLGQMQQEASIPQLTASLEDMAENPMVRHECAEALGSIAKESCLTTLEAFAKDEERVVRESCEVALDMYDYENSADFQYADSLSKLKSLS